MGINGSTDEMSLEESIHNSSIFYRNICLLKVSIAFLFLLAIVIRVYCINGPGIVIDRQYRSFLIARAYYFESIDSISDWRKSVATTSSQRQEFLEPQIMEYIVATIYRIVHGEYFGIARFVSSFFWLIGCVPLFKIAKRIGSLDSAFFTIAYYLFSPFAILMSLSFLPESLMIMMFLFSILSIIRYYDQPSNFRLIFASFVSGAAIFIRPLVVFAIFGAFISLAIQKKESMKQFICLQFLIFVTLGILPSVLFYGYGIFLSEHLRWKVEVSFLPHLFLSAEFWKDWLQTGFKAVGFTPLVIAVLGFSVLRKRLSRNLLIGLWVGYAAFCLFFNYFISFATYYHSQLIVIVALSFGPAISLFVHNLSQSFRRWHGWAAIACAIFLIVLFNFRQVNRQQVYPKFESQQTAFEIGEIVNHSSRVAYLAYIYGLPLEYYGELAGEHWPRRNRSWPLKREGEQPLSVEERFTVLGFSPEYFIVTNFGEYYRHHSDLQNFLEKNCSLVAQSEYYLIYRIPGGIFHR